MHTILPTIVLSDHFKSLKSSLATVVPVANCVWVIYVCDREVEQGRIARYVEVLAQPLAAWAGAVHLSDIHVTVLLVVLPQLGPYWINALAVSAPGGIKVDEPWLIRQKAATSLSIHVIIEKLLVKFVWHLRLICHKWLFFLLMLDHHDPVQLFMDALESLWLLILYLFLLRHRLAIVDYLLFLHCFDFLDLPFEHCLLLIDHICRSFLSSWLLLVFFIVTYIF